MRFLRYLLIASVLMVVYSVALLSLNIPCSWIAMGLGLVAMLLRRRFRASAFGTARWANLSDLSKGHLGNGSNGVPLGYMNGRIGPAAGTLALFDRRISAKEACKEFLASLQRSPPMRLVTLADVIHLICFSPTGGGKGASFVIPMLLNDSADTICLDVKGENCQLTAAHREREFGHQIERLDPWRLTTLTPSRFNVLDAIDPFDPECIDAIRSLAESIIQKSPNEAEIHWPQKAEVMLAGIITAVVFFCPPELRSIQQVCTIMADKALFNKAIVGLQQSTELGGILSRIGNEMAQSVDKELAGILSTANRSLTVFTSPAVAESTGSTSDFDPAQLGRGRGMTVYLVVPLKYLRSHAGLLRLWVTALTGAVAKGSTVNRRPVNVILDECASLGHLEVIDDMVTIGRGYGLRVRAFFQSMAQMKTNFPNSQDQTILSNCTQVFFGVQDFPTAEYVSNYLGTESIVLASGGGSSSVSHQGSEKGTHSSHSTSQNTNWAQHGKKLLFPDQVIQQDPRTAITLHSGCRPIATYLQRYYEKDFKKKRDGISPIKATLDAVSIFLMASALAVGVTVAIFFPSHFPGRRTHVQGDAQAFRADQEQRAEGGRAIEGQRTSTRILRSGQGGVPRIIPQQSVRRNSDRTRTARQPRPH